MDRLLEDAFRRTLAEPPEWISEDDLRGLLQMIKSEYGESLLQQSSLMNPTSFFFRGVVAGIEAERKRQSELRTELSQMSILSKASDLLGWPIKTSDSG